MDSDGRTGARLPPIALLSGARLELDVEQASPEATSALRVVRWKLDQRQWRSRHVETVPPLSRTRQSPNSSARWRSSRAEDRQTKLRRPPRSNRDEFRRAQRSQRV